MSSLVACRIGVCHNCESGLVSGTVVYGQRPLDDDVSNRLGAANKTIAVGGLFDS